MYKIELKKQAIKVYLKLPAEIRKQIDTKLDYLARAPYDLSNNVKKLNGMSNCYRLRVNDYRVIYNLHSNKFVIKVIKIAHRKEAYR